MVKALIYVLDDSVKGEYSSAVQIAKEVGWDVDVFVDSPFAKANPTVSDVELGYDVLIIVGGYAIYYAATGYRPPRREWGVRPSRDLAKLASSAKLVIAPLAVPAFLARLGLLSGRRATVLPTTDLIAILREAGVAFEKGPVVRDGAFVTVTRLERNLEQVKKVVATT